jgi:hypothetical protein
VNDFLPLGYRTWYDAKTTVGLRHEPSFAPPTDRVARGELAQKMLPFVDQLTIGNLKMRTKTTPVLDL